MKSKELFFEEYNVDKENFNKCGLIWEDLVEIYTDYKKLIASYTTVSATIAEILRTNEEVHSVRSRVKDPEHLIDKIIRKTIRKHLAGNTDYKITVSNYETEVTDIVGIRVLHLYKEQAGTIDQMIRDTWDLQETPTIYYRSGDIQSDEINSTNDFELKVHPAGYRSWHYLISTQTTKKPTIVEIQVRTIFEEGWSEIDHRLRYPSQLENQLLNNQLLVLNRLAGNADEMVNTIIETISTIAYIRKEKEDQEGLIEDLKSKLESLNTDVGAEKLQPLSDSIRKLEETNNSYNLNGLRSLGEAVSNLSQISQLKIQPIDPVLLNALKNNVIALGIAKNSDRDK